MSDLLKQSITAITNGFKAKSFSATELTKIALEKAHKNIHNSFITVSEDVALAQAAIADKNIASGNMRPLEGIPCAIKDLFCTKGVLTTCASKMLSNFIPRYESCATQSLFDAGAIMIGKTNMDEFAMGSANINSYYGPCINPLKDKRDVCKKLVPGGSSGGAAVAVKEGSSTFSLGTDTGGSVRQPASFCGIVGVKPSYGLASRYGMTAYASSLDQAGVFTNSVEDAAAVLNTICHHDARDSTSIPNHLRKFKDFGSKIGLSIKGLRIGIPKEYKLCDINPEILRVWTKSMQKLSDLGAIITDISLPNVKHAIEVYYITSTAEASSNLARFDGIRYGYAAKCDSIDEKISLNDLYMRNRGDGFGAEVKRRIILGTFVLSSQNYEEYYVKASKVRRIIKQDFDDAFLKVDAILCPATPNVAFGIDEKISDPILMYLNDIFTVPVNLTGLPGASIPVDIDCDSGLPIGMQIITDHLRDDVMFQVMSAL